MTNVLSQLLEELRTGNLRVVDLTTPLGPDTPVIDLPPIFAPSPGLTLTEISRYDVFERPLIGMGNFSQLALIFLSMMANFTEMV